MSATRTIGASLPALMALLLGGCVSGFSSKQAPQQTYVLRLQPAVSGTTASAPPSRPSPASSAAADTVQVLLPAAFAGLGGDSIAVLRGGGRLDYYSGARWAAPAPSMLQSLVIQTLRRQGRFALVESDSGPFAAAYLLSLELTHFEADYAAEGAGAAPTVRVELVCTLGGRVGRHVLESFTATSSVNADADRMQAVVAAFERATNDVLAQVAAHIVPPPTAASAAPAI
jgi:cholesterol transport system auxiliary component